jgi:hypothetical protein
LACEKAAAARRMVREARRVLLHLRVVVVDGEDLERHLAPELLVDGAIDAAHAAAAEQLDDSVAPDAIPDAQIGGARGGH